MDYKYIEQLIDRYFEGTTTLEEEQILRQFFAQDTLPVHLRQWQPLFLAEQELACAHLGDAFDERILTLTGEHHVKALAIPLRLRLRPLYRVAAFLAFAIVVGTAVEYSAAPLPDAPRTPLSVQEQDELDADATTPLDIRSAELMESDSLLIQ